MAPTTPTPESPLREDAEGRLVIGLREARRVFADLVARAQYGGHRIHLERHGKVVAVLLAAEDLRILEAIEARVDAEAAERAAREDDGKRYTTEQVRAAGRAAAAEREAAKPKQPLRRPAKARRTRSA